MSDHAQIVRDALDSLVDERENRGATVLDVAQAIAALAALVNQAADAQASREAKEGEILRLLETAAAGFMRERALEARAVRAEEALRFIKQYPNGVGDHAPAVVAAKALAAAGADT